MLVVVDALVEAGFRRHARRAHPAEACGLLGRAPTANDQPGRRRRNRDPRRETDARPIRFVRYVPMANLARRTDRFVMDPVAVARVEHALRASGLSLAGVFHSHPDHPAVPSEADRRAAWPDIVQLILSGSTGEWTAWRTRCTLRSVFE